MEFNKQDTFDKVTAIIIEKLRTEKERIQPTATLQDLGADSLDIVEMIMKLEEQFGIEIDDQKAEELKNVQDVVNYVHALRTK